MLASYARKVCQWKQSDETTWNYIYKEQLNKKNHSSQKDIIYSLSSSHADTPRISGILIIDHITENIVIPSCINYIDTHIMYRWRVLHIYSLGQINNRFRRTFSLGEYLQGY